ncbi:DUF3052 domain-containing protein [Scleromatobacter humisilvae]|uniref:DUF3052 domain-containing protein n=1 Tax=Scleromatobacter humisilvae TaxID=2897159 RepID=A0A9X2C466_9BURK|nr:DUF3052 domain-containing protein [Scleromatobacter humisilvae]MCK9688760.1 DUF3052 domain-containing protein [Scleromatobacter humisilvae]
MATTTPGYSGTPLARKLGIAAGSRVLALHAPDGYRDWLAPLPEGVRFEAAVSAAVDVVHVFSDRRADLKQQLDALRPRIGPAAAVWVSWPKKASKVPTDVTEDTIRELALPIGFVDVKVCAVSEVWSGLKLVIRKELRGQPNSTVSR